MPWLRYGALPVVFLLCSVLLAPAFAAEEFKVYSEDWGLGGAVKSGLWSPLYLELESVGRDCTAVLEVEAVGDQRVVPVFSKPVELVADTPARHWLYLRAPTSTYRRTAASFEWRLREGRRVRVRSRWDPPVMLPAADPLIAVLRTSGAMRSGIGGLYEGRAQVRTNVVFHTTARAPDRALGYEGADFLVWFNPDPSELTEVAQREAVVDYVVGGGHLVLAAGSGWQALTRSFLAELLPAVPTGTELVAELPALSAYGLPTEVKKEVVLLRLTDVRGEVLMSHQGRPVIVRGTVGQGRVTLIGFDPAASPFARLGRRNDFWASVLGLNTTAADDRQVSTMRPVSEPLVRPLNDFPGFTPVNVVVVAVFLIGYVIVIGPVDYFVLKRFKKLHWTWVTFPSVAILSSVLAFWLLSAERITGLLANTVSVVDASPGEEEVVGTTFMTFLSPRQTRYDVRLEGARSGTVVPREFDVLGGAGPMGMGRTSCRVSADGERIEELLVRILDAQTLEASWQAVAGQLPQVDLRLEGAGLVGSLTNDTGERLVAVVVVFAGQVVELGTLEPGETVKLTGRRDQELERYVGQLESKVPQGGLRGFGWQEAVTERADADPTARWLSFFSVVGGSQGGFRRWAVTGRREGGLAFDLAARLQLTGLQSRSSAVVLYGVERSFVRILLSGQAPKSWDWTLVRLHVPVGGAGAAPGGG